jgi:hypothetical protein
MQIEIQAMAEQFGVAPHALACLMTFLQDKLTKPEAAKAFAEATPAMQDEIIKAGVKAWHDQSTAMLAELQEGKTEWAQAARQKIASDVWHQARAKGKTA